MFHLFFCPQIHHHMIAAVGLAQGIIEFCYLLLVLFPVGKLDPQFPRHLIEGDDFFADQFARFIILCCHPSHDKYFRIRLDQRSISLIISRKHNHFHRSHQIFHPVMVGNAQCFGHVQCDSIIMGDARIESVPAITANCPDAQLIHEAAIGKIAGDQLLKLETLGLTPEQAEETILKGFLA